MTMMVGGANEDDDDELLAMQCDAGDAGRSVEDELLDEMEMELEMQERNMEERENLRRERGRENQQEKEEEEEEEAGAGRRGAERESDGRAEKENEQDGGVDGHRTKGTGSKYSAGSSAARDGATNGGGRGEHAEDGEDARRAVKRQRLLRGRALLLAEIDDAMPRYVSTLPRRLASTLPGASGNDSGGGVMGVTSEKSGERVYIAVGSNGCNTFEELFGGDLKSMEKQIASVVRNSTQGGMLTRSADELMLEIAEDRRLRARAAAEDTRTTTRANENEATTSTAAGLDRSASDAAATSANANAPAVSLLVDTYAPKTFTDLLSDERTNREVLFWFKQWDQCVFGKPVTAKIARRQPFNQRNGDLTRGGGEFGRSNTKTGSSHAHRKSTNAPSSANADAAGLASSAERGPMTKVLLLSGAPGWGKTTLAHVIAQHCGYRVVEVNASDDRTEASLKRRILDAVQMRPGVGADRRPNCLVLDEIDGTANAGEGRGAIQALLNILKADSAADTARGDQSGAKADKGKRKRGERLNRPIVCICNDLYAPALRPLREMAQIHRFSAPSIRRMTTRLRYICDAEAMQIEPQILRSLAEYSNRDVRSSLNTLQLLKNSENPGVDLSKILSDSNGRKDITQGAADVWKRVFHAQHRGRGRTTRLPFRQGIGGGGGGGNSGAAVAADDDELFQLLGNLGEHSLVLTGCFHNYINMNFNDPRMTRAVDCLDWITDADQMMNHSFTNGNFALDRYLPAPVVALRKLASVPEKPYIGWPSADFKATKERAATKELLKIWKQKFDAEVSACASSSSALQRDLLPHLMRILSAQSLRVTSPHLMTTSEKKSMEELVDTMIRYNLSYRAGFGGARSGASSGALELDPPVDGIHAYESIESNVRPLSGEMKQILSHQIQLERIRRSTTSAAAAAASSVATVDPPSAAHKASASYRMGHASRRPAPKSTSVSDATKGLVAKAVSRAPRVNPMKNLFQRSGLKVPERRQLTEMKAPVGGGDVASDTLAPSTEHVVRYKFREGFSAAVKRRVKFADLM